MVESGKHPEIRTSEPVSTWQTRNTVIVDRAAVLLAPRMVDYWVATPDERAAILRDYVDLAVKLDAAASAL